MKQQELVKFKDLFELEINNLVYSKAIINEDFHIKKDDLLDETDRTSVDLEQSIRIKLRNREALYLKKIEAALRRIDDGSFGVCMDCEDEIEIRRLRARPTTTLCLKCKEAQERMEKEFIGGRERVGAIVKIA